MGTQRILIVDGDRDSRLVYRILLEHHGYGVVEAEDGAAALRLAEADDFAAVVTELTLRQVDGHTLLERLRAGSRTREVCVIVLTARGLEEDRRLAEAAGCTRFLTKPLEPKTLVDEVTRLLTRPG